jgi:hypothetical protein
MIVEVLEQLVAMSGQQWEYGWAAVMAQEVSHGVTQQGTLGPVSRLVMVGTAGNVPAFENAPPHDGLGEYLDRAGDEGWEVAATISNGYQTNLIFKRPKGWTKDAAPATQ